jgi:hypothetical protein
MSYLWAYGLFTSTLFFGNLAINKTRRTICRGWLVDTFTSTCLITVWELCKIATSNTQ